MTESIAEGLSVVGLVVGFPLLLLALMLSLGKLESWGLRVDEPRADRETEMVDAAVESVEQLGTVPYPSGDGAGVEDGDGAVDQDLASLRDR